MSDLELYLSVGSGVLIALCGALGYAYKKRSEKPGPRPPVESMRDQNRRSS